jgi:ribonuclease HI
MLQPFRFFGGRFPYMAYSLPILTHIQTDASFHQRSKSGGVAALIRLPSGEAKGFIEPLDRLQSSTEAEWASIYYGIELARRADQGVIGLENDCLGVIRSIIFNSTGKHEYARYYHHKIKKTAADMDWCGIRWIPRRMNRADELLRDLR